MKWAPTELDEVLLVEPRVFPDARGRFLETWREDRYRSAGIAGPFVQDNVSVSRRGVVRGLHFQHPHGQGKLVSVLRGEIWDVAVDVRQDSRTFGRWTARTLSAANARQLWIPAGFAHGFAALADDTLVHYKCTGPYHAPSERTLIWNDPAIGISWPVDDPILSEKDREGLRLAEISAEALPRVAGAEPALRG